MKFLETHIQTCKTLFPSSHQSFYLYPSPFEISYKSDTINNVNFHLENKIYYSTLKQRNREYQDKKLAWLEKLSFTVASTLKEYESNVSFPFPPAWLGNTLLNTDEFYIIPLKKTCDCV